MNSIYPSAIIAKNVQMGDGNEIGPGCVIDGPAVLGSRNKLWMNVYVGPGTTIGDDNQLHMGAVVGHTPQDLAFANAPSSTKIGSRNQVREYVTIHRGTKEGTATVIGDDCFLMANAHIAHNCELGNKVILVNVASLTGYCIIEEGAFISGIVGLHQFTRVGRMAMISALSAVNKDVPPYMLCGGRPGVIQGLNVVAMRRAGFDAATREDIKRAYKLLYRSELNVSNALEAIVRECRSEEVTYLAEFVRASKRGICSGLGSDASEDDESLLPKKTLHPDT